MVAQSGALVVHEGAPDGILLFSGRGAAVG